MERNSKKYTVSKKINSASSEGIRCKGEKWTQDEMETLVSLCVAHGRSGILSKETNKATIVKKDTQWATIMNFFNSLHPPRDKKALIGRYKFIIMHLRKNNALEHRNIFATGGGLSTLKEEKTPFEITGPFLELRNILGISITGLSGFGSDSQTLNTSIEAPVTSQIDEPLTIYSFEDTVTDHWTKLVEDPEDSLPKTVQVESELPVGEVVVNSEIELVPPANLSVTVASISASPIPSQSQYFPTQTQRQKGKRKISAVSDANVECRKQEKHAAVMKYDAMLMEAKIKELRENEMDRQLERERSAELHKLELDQRAMMIQHEETLFSLKKDVLLAQRDAFARVSPQNVMLLSTQIDGLNMTPIRAAELINTVGGSEKHTE